MKSKRKSSEAEFWHERRPKSVLEQAFIEEYLLTKGYKFKDLKSLPPDESRRLMKKACLYASIKLTEIEARAGYRKKVGE